MSWQIWPICASTSAPYPFVLAYEYRRRRASPFLFGEYIALNGIGRLVIEKEGKIIWEEGCLSVPDFVADVSRAERIHLTGSDLDGGAISIRAEGLQAVCFQHEIDHLDGVLFIDHISRLKRNMYVKRRQKQVRRELEESGVAS